MKFISLLFLCTFALSSCELGSELQKISEGETKRKKITKALKGLDRINQAKIVPWMPTKLGEMTRVEFEIADALPEDHPHAKDVASVRMTFKSPNNTVDVAIVDGVGRGANMLGNYVLLRGVFTEKITKGGYERNQLFDGENTMLYYVSSPKKSTISYLRKDRYIIRIVGDLEPEELWELHKKLNIDKLIN